MYLTLLERVMFVRLLYADLTNWCNQYKKGIYVLCKVQYSLWLEFHDNN